MTLAEFRAETAALDGATEILVLSPWGDLEPSAFVTRDDLEDDDPVRENFPQTAILITGDAC